MEHSRRDFVRDATVLALGGLAASGSSGCADTTPPQAPAPPPDGVGTGGSRLVPVVGGKYKVWTKKLGSGPIRLLTLHGGPGFGHEYFECFEDFLPQAGVEFYYYDQLDSHYSDQPNDESLWTVERFTDEVEEVRKGLGLTQFYLYGQSWGGMLAIEYALKYPAELKGLVISNMTASVSSYEAYAKTLRAALPAEAQAVMDKYEATGDYGAPEYKAAVFTHVYAQHLCRLDPWPEPAARAPRLKHFNERIYNYLQGPNEFVITGKFKDWDRWTDLPRIGVPTLVMGGRYDTMNPADVQREGSLIPKSRTHICPNGSHFSLYDDQADYMRALIEFLRDVEAGTFVPQPRTNG
jgi:proline iminopeptidase